MAVAVTAIVVPIMAVLFRTGTRLQATVDKKSMTQMKALNGQVFLNDDTRKMNEVVFAGPDRMVFILDRFGFGGRGTLVFDPMADPDGDGVQNRRDPDDDGDGLEGYNGDGRVRTARDLIGRPKEGWKQGNDLQDDDDDNDGNRDVRCLYVFDREKKTLERHFSFNEAPFLLENVLFDHVENVKFEYFGNINLYPSPMLEWLPAEIDADGDRVLNEEEMKNIPDSVGSWGDEFFETRWITTVGYEITIKMNKDSTPNVVRGLVTPQLMAAKEKFPND